MKHLQIHNIGALKKISLELKRINILIGMQSSGKSTINKIACYCSWVEKEIFLNQSADAFKEKGYFESNLVHFHKLEGFIEEHSFIKYETDVMSFSFSKKTEQFEFEWKQDKWGFIRSKTIYIPAERNIVATIPNWFEVKLETNNLRSFMADWEESRSYYSKKPISILDLDVSYEFDKGTSSDNVYLKNKKLIKFTNASSGLQSLIPLLTLVKYVTKDVFESKKSHSVKEKNILINFRSSIIAEFHNKAKNDQLPILRSLADDNKWNKYENIQLTNIFLEEPEVNLFPTTQRELLKSLVKQVYHNAENRAHSIFITTHSPYFLTSLNNLIYASNCAKDHKDEVNNIISEKYWVEFQDVSAWFLQNGEIESILDTELMQLDAIKIDTVSTVLNEEFDQLLNIEYREV